MTGAENSAQDGAFLDHAAIIDTALEKDYDKLCELIAAMTDDELTELSFACANIQEALSRTGL